MLCLARYILKSIYILKKQNILNFGAEEVLWGVFGCARLIHHRTQTIMRESV